MNEVQRAYIAGLFDGEGCITINNHKATGYGSLCCLLTTTDVPSVDYFKEQYGGHTQMLKRRKATWRDQYQWVVSAKNAIQFLYSILPYMKIKKPQALIGIKYQEMLIKNNMGRIKPEDRVIRDNLKQQLKDLKRV